MNPAWIMILGAVPVLWLRGPWRAVWMLLLPIAGGALLWWLPAGVSETVTFFGLPLQPVRVDPLARLFATAFHLAALLSVIYALNLRDTVQHVAILVYAGASVGGALAGDLVTLFVFWEVAGAASAFLIWARRSERAYRAGLRYLVMQFVSGLLLLAGIAVRVRASGDITFDHIGVESPGGLLIFLAIGVKCGWPVLHAWLRDTYAEATVVGTVVLSAFTTKLAIYALARSYGGTEWLVWIGAVMTCFPVFYAVIENDLRRVLAYSMINQLGFMVVGVGIGTELAVNGAAAHAFADILFKGLLFMSMGAVLLRAGTTNGSDLGGLYKSMPQTAMLCLVGAASISAFPLFSAFATKSLIMEAAASEHRTLIFLMLLFASAGVFHHAGIKIPYFAFFAHDRGIRCEEAPLNMRIAMGLAAAFCIGIGCAPQALYALLPYPVHYVPYTAPHVINQLQLLFLSAMAFTVLMRTGLYPPELRAVNLDFDWCYRRGGPRVWRALVDGLRRLRDAVGRPALQWVLRSTTRALAPARPHGPLALPWSTSMTLWWSALLLGVYLLLYLA